MEGERGGGDRIAEKKSQKKAKQRGLWDEEEAVELRDERG